MSRARRLFILSLFFLLLLAAGPALAAEGAGRTAATIASRDAPDQTVELAGQGQLSVLGATATTPPVVAGLAFDAQPVIIELAAAPLVQARLAGRPASAQAEIEDLTRRLALDLARLENPGRLARGLAPLSSRTVLTRTYRQVFSGAAARLSAEAMAQAARLPYVRRIVEDREVRASLAVSVPLIGAPTLWAAPFAVRGENMRVAVIDTGVDYGHIDLGQGFGPGYKVAGGHDFVNDDEDPMDDHGHGTHVAGIIAADGPAAQGVSPKAEIYAYKVLGANGSGYMSDIIAALERAADPDDDGDTTDHLDVANLSLGGSGDPDDPTSQAVDNATAAGVVVVVAAGNSGPSNSTIGSPGCARSALTVGASDDLDTLASFSSRGPTAKTYAVKPDVLAPGVSVCSSQWATAWQSSQCLDEEHTAISGTSMATPHVAGGAALLRQLHPDWSPEMVKAALMLSAEDLDLPLLSQGAGRIDLPAANAVQALALPASVSLGLADLGSDVWEVSRTVTVMNLSPLEQSFTPSLAAGLPEGVSAVFDPAGLTVPAGGSGGLTVTIRVDNATVPNLGTAPSAYEGRIELTSALGTLCLPLGFVKSHLLRLTLDGAPWTVLVHDRAAQAQAKAVDADYAGAPVDFLLPEGTWDVVVSYRSDLETGTSDFVVREGVNVSGLTELAVSQSEAGHRVELEFTSDSGGYTPIRLGCYRFWHQPSNIGSWTMSSGFSWTNRVNRFNTLSENYRFEWQAVSANTDRRVLRFQNGFAGLTSGQAHVVDQEAWRRYRFIYNVDPGTPSLFPLQSLSTDPTSWSFVSATSWGNWETPLSPPFVQEFLSQPEPYPGFTMGFGGVEAWAASPDSGQRFFVSAYQRPGLAEGLALYGAHDPVPMAEGLNGNLELGLAPPHFSGRLDIEAGQVRLYAAHGLKAQVVRTQTFDDPLKGHLAYTLRRSGETIASGQTSTVFTDAYRWLNLPLPGAYEIILDLPGCYVAGLPGTSVLTAAFDSTRADPDPPEIESLQIVGDGRPLGVAGPRHKARLRLVLAEEPGLAVAMAWRPAAGGDWQELAVGDDGGGVFSAPLPVRPGLVALKVTASDAAGNSLTQEWLPAYLGQGAGIQAILGLLLD